jgi:hypothetical protein
MSPKNNNYKRTLLIDAPSKEKDGGTWSVLRNPGVHSTPEEQSWTTTNTGGKQHRTSKPCLQAQCSQQRYEVKDVAIVLIHASNRGFLPKTTTNSNQAREMPTHLGDASKEVNDTLRHRRRQPDNAKQDFRLYHRTSPTLLEMGLCPCCKHHRRRSTSMSWPKCLGSHATRTAENNTFSSSSLLSSTSSNSVEVLRRRSCPSEK